MEVGGIIAAYVQIVGLLADFAAHRNQLKGDKNTADVKEFVDWLATHGHNDLVALIDRNQATSISIKAALAEDTATILARIAELERLIAAGSVGHGPFENIAIAVSPRARLSEQQQSVLTAFSMRRAGKALVLSTFEGDSLAFLDGDQIGAYQPEDPQFFHADMDDLVALKFLSYFYNDGGNKVFQLTRVGNELAKQLVAQSSSPV
jgi:hypothetical protein